MKARAIAGQLSLEPRTELHCHTTCSDGGLSPTALVEKAQKFQIDVLSITDHDTTDAYAEASAPALVAKMRLLSGCECTCSEQGKEYHLLAYGFDLQHRGFQSYLEHTRAQRRVRCLSILQKLSDLGMPLSLADVLEFAGGQSIVRPHIASALRKHGYVESTQEAFDKYLSNEAPAYVAIDDQPLEGAIALIHEAGGVAVIAHPGRMISSARLVQLIANGLDGIEVAHPSHNKSQTRYYRGMARSYKLLATGGSDFHASRFYDDTYFGQFSIAPETIEDLEHRAAAHAARAAAAICQTPQP